jgi:hypothetical protein
MSNKKDKLIRKEVRRNVDDQFKRLLVSMLSSPFFTRLRYAFIIIFKLGYKDLVGGANGVKQ